VSNPVKEIKNLQDDNKIERFLTNDQMTRLMAEVRSSESGMLQHIVLFLLYTGARKREVLDATWADVDWARKSWRIPKTKSGKIRHIPLSVGAMQLLGALRDMAAKMGGMNSVAQGELARRHIFANPKTGLPFVSFFYSWDSARKRAGLPDLRVHDLRHSFASFLVNAGRSLYEVQELLGHADIRTTSRYAHLSRERLFAAVEAIPVL
jgi:integrase